MKKGILIAAVCFGLQLSAHAQLAPQTSAAANVEQKVGLTDVTVHYSRPAKRNRVIFGDVVPMNAIWRTGANENTTITFSDNVAFGKDSLKAGTYALYTKPGKDSWEVIFYSEHQNWGNPEKWDDGKVVLRLNAKPIALNDAVEIFTIAIDPMETTMANLSISWDKTKVSVPFTVPTDAKVMTNIRKTMSGPSADEYAAAADYYLTNKKDLKQALEWANKSLELYTEAFWVMRTKAMIQAEMGDKAGAIATAKVALPLTEKAGYPEYAKMLNNSIAEWSKK